MPAKTVITLTDSALTPEAGTPAANDRDYTPSEMRGDVHVFTSDFIASGGDKKSTMTLSLRGPNGTDETDKFKLTLKIPEVHTVDGIEVKAYENAGFINLVFDKDSTRDNRRDLRKLLANALNHADIVSMIDDLLGLY